MGKGSPGSTMDLCGRSPHLPMGLMLPVFIQLCARLRGYRPGPALSELRSSQDVRRSTGS